MRALDIFRLLLVAALGAPAFPAGSTEALYEFMYAKLAESYTTGQGLCNEGGFLILANPGIPLTAGMLKDRYAVSTLVDRMPRPARIYAPSGARISGLYARILDLAKVTRITSQAQRGLAISGKAVLFDPRHADRPTAAYTAFLKYQAAYDEARDALNMALAEHRASGAPVPSDLEPAVKKAEQDWIARGSRARIRSALAAVRKAYDTNAPVMLKALRDELSRGRIIGGSPEPWYSVLVNPPMAGWLSNLGWSPWTFRQTDVKPRRPRERVPLNPDGSAQVPEARPLKTATMTLKVNLKRVVVARPWLDLDLFSARTWQLPEGAGFTMVSTGNLADPDPGMMPLVVTGFLLARNLTLTWSKGQGEAPETAPAQVGPFRLGAAQTRKSGGETVISAPDPQIIAFFCEVVPRSPDPDPKLFP